MVLEAFARALQNMGDIQYLLFMCVGTIVGLMVGILPGLGGLTAMALMLVFIFRIPPEMGLPLLVAMHAVTYTGGSITSVLLNIPGEPTNSATLLDGFPMTQKGEAGRALGAALASSGLGGAVTVLFALAMIPLMIPMVMAFASPEMVFIILLGLMFVGVLGRESMSKGLISGGLGLFFSFIGFQTTSGVARFTFGSLYLYDGIPLVPFVLGLFAIPETIELATSGATIAKRQVVIKGMGQVLEGCKDVFRHWGVWLRSSLIGYIVGIIPGIGAMTAIFVAYGQAKRTSKHPERFGTGVVEGVIAPESANNAKEAGALLTTMALGIPGSAGMAILIGAYLMLGLTPGPEMMTKHLDLSLSLLLTIVLANIIGAVICLLAAPRLANVALIPARILVPLITVLVVIGAYATDGEIMDIIMMLIFGVVGVVVVRFGFNRPAIILGFVLGHLFEKYVFLSLDTVGPLFFTRPISLAIILIIIVVFGYGPIKKTFRQWMGARKAA